MYSFICRLLDVEIFKFVDICIKKCVDKILILWRKIDIRII